MTSLEGKVAVVTGGTRGIGKCIANAMIDLDMEVFMRGTVDLDVSDGLSVRDSMEAIVANYERIDILVNCAGTHDSASMFGVNYHGARLCSEEAIRLGATRIVNIGSVAGEFHSPRMIDYSASKAALISLTKSLARKYAPDVIVNCVSPGIIDCGMGAEELRRNPEVVEMNLLKKAGTAEEIARAVVFCCQAEFMTGQVIGINGGLVI